MTGPKKPAKWKRKNLHLDENTAHKVRMQALRWGLNETQTVKQLLHVGLQVAAHSSAQSEQAGSEMRALRMIFRQLLNLQVETLLYQREVAANVAVLQAQKGPVDRRQSGTHGAAQDSQESRDKILVDLDKRVSEKASRAAKEIRETIELKAGLARLGDPSIESS